jgi:subtilisin family serine protease
MAVAATIPADKLGQLASLRGVTNVEKDHVVYLDDELEGGKNDQHPMSYAVAAEAGVEVQSLDPAAVSLDEFPQGYANFLYTGAANVWNNTAYGQGTVVAVVDTGTAPNACLSHAVIGAPGYPNGYNASGDGIPATDPSNHWHGTHVGGVIASRCALDFSADPSHPIYQAQFPYLGWPVDFVPILGQAPLAQLYPVKVFPASGAGVPSSVILDGLDHVLTLKKDGLLDVDVINMSLGGPTGWDGRDAYDRFMEELADAHILVVTSAGNEGPIPNSVGSPGTSFGALSVGALDYAPSSRTFYEYLGLAYWPGAAGQGLVMRPTAETRVVNFSSRGPLSDGRFGPEIAALGHWTFHEGPGGELRWAGGTSFSAPTVSGGAALLNAWWEAQGNETDPTILENVLLLGADPEVVGPTWQGINDQGYGTLDVPASLNRLMSRDWRLKPAKKAGELTANVLGEPVKGKVQTWESDQVTVGPSEPFNAIFEISQWTSKVTIEVYDMDAPDNSASAFWPNALEVHVQSAKRTSYPHPVEYYWYPYAYGDAFEIVIEDGPWTSPFGLEANQPMEPGLMKLSLIGDYSNEAPVSFKVRITRENFREKLPIDNRVANGVIKMTDAILVPVDIPAGTTAATFDLTWHRDWSKFPTSDLDMFIVAPDYTLASIDGITGSAPERATITDPVPGTWYVLLDAYEVHHPDNYDLYLALE